MTARARLRRRLLLVSAPVVVVLVIAMVKLTSVVFAGDSAANAFATRDSASLRGDVAMLSELNVVEPAKASFAAGALAVLTDRLTDADAHFSESVTRTDAGKSCPARVNLELVRETLGDRAAAAFDGTAAARYRSALDIVENAPDGCFAGNTDSDEQRRTVRETAAARLTTKLDAALAIPPPPAAPPRNVAPPPPPASPTDPAQTDRDAQLRLNPASGDPLERLQQILRDAAR